MVSLMLDAQVCSAKGTVRVELRRALSRDARTSNSSLQASLRNWRRRVAHQSPALLGKLFQMQGAPPALTQVSLHTNALVPG